jgi:hypothetical protein
MCKGFYDLCNAAAHSAHRRLLRLPNAAAAKPNPSIDDIGSGTEMLTVLISSAPLSVTLSSPRKT